MRMWALNTREINVEGPPLTVKRIDLCLSFHKNGSQYLESIQINILQRCFFHTRKDSNFVDCLYADPQMACRDSSTGPSHCRSTAPRSSPIRFLHHVLCR